MADSSTTFAPGSLEAECPGGLDWAWYNLGECVREVRDKVSIAFGVMSIIAWLLFGFPQIIENCRSKIPDTAISPFLLFFWLLGDSLNFIGGFLTNQLFFQKLLAGYTVFVDIILSSQYFYYLCLHRRKLQKMNIDECNDVEKSEESESSDPESNKRKVLAMILLGFMVFSFYEHRIQTDQPLESSSKTSRQLLQVTKNSDTFSDFLPTIGSKVGYAFGWASALVYVAGRCHQIVLNWRRKTTEGLSFYLFFLAVLGNTFYACQIFIKSIDTVFILTSLPWILGSLGVLLFDAFILVQFFMYRKNQHEQDFLDAEYGIDEDEKSSANKH